MFHRGDAALQAACGGCKSRLLHQFNIINRVEGEEAEPRALEARESRCEPCRRDHFPTFRSQAGKTRPGAHNPGDPERYRGLPPFFNPQPGVVPAGGLKELPRKPRGHALLVIFVSQQGAREDAIRDNN